MTCPLVIFIPWSSDVVLTNPPNGAEMVTRFWGGTSSIPFAFIVPLTLRCSTFPISIAADLNCSSDRTISVEDEGFSALTGFCRVLHDDPIDRKSIADHSQSNLIFIL